MVGFYLENLSLITILIIAFFVWSSRFESCNARQDKYWRQSKTAPAETVFLQKEKGYGVGHDQSRFSKFVDYHYIWADETMATNQGQSSATFNVYDYGAKGDGHTDDTKVIIS